MRIFCDNTFCHVNTEGPNAIGLFDGNCSIGEKGTQGNYHQGNLEIKKLFTNSVAITLAIGEGPHDKPTHGEKQNQHDKPTGD